MNNVSNKSASATEPFFRRSYDASVPEGRLPSDEIRRQAAWIALYAAQNGEDEDMSRDLLEVVEALMRTSLEVESLETSAWHARTEQAQQRPEGQADMEQGGAEIDNLERSDIGEAAE